MTDKKLPPAESAARDRVYAFLSTCPEVMNFLNDKDEDIAREILDNPAKISLAKVFITVAVREMWVEGNRPLGPEDCPVGDWQAIDKVRLDALGDVRIQCAKIAVDLCNEYENQAVDIRIATEKKIAEIKEQAEDSVLASDRTMAEAISILLPAINEKMFSLTSTMENGGIIDYAELLQAYDSQSRFDVVDNDFIDQVTVLSKRILKSAEKNMEDNNNG